MLKASFVIPWYGREIPGGAEAECRGVAENLAARGVPVEVLTTCLHSHGRSWDADFHSPGESRENGVLVRRFPIDRRNAELFNLLNRRLLAGQLLPPRQEKAFLDNMVNSRALYHFISEAKNRLFLPLPYLFSTTWMTARLAPDRTAPLTCLHDEGYAYLRPLRQTYRSCRALAFLSRAEQRLAQDLWGVEKEQGRLVGGGLDTDLIGDPNLFRAKYQITEPFILYAGRRDPTKNTPLLIDCFAEYKRTRPESGLRLVLIGNQPVDIPRGLENGILDLGFVSREDKAGAFAAAALFCQPSMNESFSIVIMESWLNHTPVLVHRGCAVTRDHAEVSGGGLTFSDASDFVRTVDLVLSDQGRAFAMAEAGRRYVMKNFTWETVCQKYTRLLEEAETWERNGQKRARRPAPPPSPSPRLRQFFPSAQPSLDALGDSWSIAHQLRETGQDGGIYIAGTQAPLKYVCRPFGWLAAEAGPDDPILVHYDLARSDFRLAEAAAAAPGRLLLIRLHGAASAESTIEDALSPFCGLEHFRRILFLTDSASSKAVIEDIGFGPVDFLPPVMPPEHFLANNRFAVSDAPYLIFPVGRGELRGLLRAGGTLDLLQRLHSQLRLFLWDDRHTLPRPGCSAFIGQAKWGALAAPQLYGLADLSGFISRSSLLIAEAGDHNWAITHAICSGVPVLHYSEESDPSFLAEIIAVLLDDENLRRAFTQDQRDSIVLEKQTYSKLKIEKLMQSLMGAGKAATGSEETACA